MKDSSKGLTSFLILNLIKLFFLKVGMSNFGFLGCNPKPTITKVISHFMAKWAQDDPPKRKITTLKFVWKINQIKRQNLIFFESDRK